MPRIRHLFDRSLHVAQAAEGDRVTNLELFFDLVYAFAFTQVTALMYHGHPPVSLLDGFIVLSLLWWSWCSYAWLANQAHANEGILQGAVIVAMVAVFIACLALPDVYGTVPGALSAAVVVVICYAVVRFTHAGVYLVAARHEPRLRRQVVVTVLVSLLPTLALLAVGATIGQPWQRLIWLGAVLYDFAAVFVTANSERGWVIQSAAHFAERHSLIVILALGESIVAIAAGLGSAHLTWRVVVGAALSILVALSLYLAYFTRLLDKLSTALERAQSEARAGLATDVFTYSHFPIIAGIIFTALGVESAMSRLNTDQLGATGGWALGAGVALFLAGTVAAQVRAGGTWPLPRIAVIVVLIGVSPLLSAAPSLAAITATAAGLLALAAVDSATASTASN